MLLDVHQLSFWQHLAFHHRVGTGHRFAAGNAAEVVLSLKGRRANREPPAGNGQQPADDTAAATNADTTNDRIRLVGLLKAEEAGM